MKNLFYSLAVLLFISSCSKTDNSIFPDDMDDDEGNNNVENIIPLKLEIEETQKNIFEHAVFKLFPDKNFMLFPLMDVYDSITWKVSNIDGRMKVLEQTDHSGRFTQQWSHHFYLPGKYQTYISGYKNNKIAYSDTTEIEIINTKDFLRYNWKDIHGSIGHSTGYVDALCEEYSFATFENIHEGMPSVTVYLRDEKKDNKPTFLEKSKKVFIDYINSLYSTLPDYNETDNTLLEKYDNLFTYKKEQAYPICIWITPKSKIALIKDEFFDEYQLYAEPTEY